MKENMKNAIKKIAEVLLWIFGIGITVCLLAGALAFVGFIVALCIGGEAATEICVFIHKTYFPWVIKITTIFSAFGLVGMYMKKAKALTISNDNENNNENNNEGKGEVSNS